MLVTDGIQRASLRESFEKRQSLEPGEVYELDVDLWSTSLILNKGHRLRIAFRRPTRRGSSRTPTPAIRTLPPGKSRVATNTVHLSAKHPSRILLPLYNGPDAVVGKIKPKK